MGVRCGVEGWARLRAPGCEGRLARGDGIAYSGRHGDSRPKFVRFQRARLVGRYVGLGRRLRTFSVRYVRSVDFRAPAGLVVFVRLVGLRCVAARWV